MNNKPNAKPMDNDLDTDTLEAVFTTLLNLEKKDAALVVAEMAFGSTEQTPEDWLRENYDGSQDKIPVVKDLRAEFDLGLIEAKDKVDEYEEILESEDTEEKTEFVSLDEISESILDVVGFKGLTITVDGELDEITQLDTQVNATLTIATANGGWMDPRDYDIKVPRDIVY